MVSDFFYCKILVKFNFSVIFIHSHAWIVCMSLVKTIHQKGVQRKKWNGTIKFHTNYTIL